MDMMLESRIPTNNASILLVDAPARIHCGLLNESGSYNRIDGGIGFALNRPRWRIRLSVDGDLVPGVPIPAELSTAMDALLQRFRDEYRLDRLLCEIMEAIPLHAGLGAKTALLMAFGAGASRLLNLGWDSHAVARYVSRGGTSGIGVHAFLNGGMIWDVGRPYPARKAQFVPSSSAAHVPPQLALSWRVDRLKIVHFRFDDAGPSGAEEEQIFRDNCPVDVEDTKSIFGEVAGRLIPSVLETEEAGIQAAIAQLQRLGLKRAEWGAQGETTQRFRSYFEQAMPGTGLGLSSMGPTMYCICLDPRPVVETVNGFGTHPIHLTVSDIFSGRTTQG